MMLNDGHTLSLQQVHSITPPAHTHHLPIVYITNKTQTNTHPQTNAHTHKPSLQEILAVFLNTLEQHLHTLEQEGFSSLQASYLKYWLHSGQQVTVEGTGGGGGGSGGGGGDAGMVWYVGVCMWFGVYMVFVYMVFVYMVCVYMVCVYMVCVYGVCVWCVCMYGECVCMESVYVWRVCM